MMLVFDGTGLIDAVGPTIEKIAPGLVGRSLGDAVRCIHPAIEGRAGAFRAEAGRRLRVELPGEMRVADGAVRTVFRGVVTSLPNGGGLLDLALGADPMPALRRHGLTARDFGVIDPIVDYLYLIEAHGLLLSEFERLSQRLDQARAAAEAAAVTDKLTGLHNRRAMDAYLLRLSRQRGRSFGLMQLDLDYFKSVNDTLGHAAGDRVLEEVAVILREEVRAGDMVARMGGDEFMLVFEDCTDADLLLAIAERMIARLERPIDWEGHDCRISGSFGITLSDYYDVPDPARLLSDVDAALYEAKRSGRARATLVRPDKAA